jgi:hypothetical protein
LDRFSEGPDDRGRKVLLQIRRRLLWRLVVQMRSEKEGTYGLLQQQQSLRADPAAYLKLWVVLRFRNLLVVSNRHQFEGKQTFENSLPNLSRINNVLQKESIFLDARSSKCLAITPDSNNKLVII